MRVSRMTDILIDDAIGMDESYPVQKLGIKRRKNGKGVQTGSHLSNDKGVHKNEICA
jgi:hypothetical protein